MSELRLAADRVAESWGTPEPGRRWASCWTEKVLAERSAADPVRGDGATAPGIAVKIHNGIIESHDVDRPRNLAKSVTVE